MTLPSALFFFMAIFACTLDIFRGHFNGENANSVQPAVLFFTEAERLQGVYRTNKLPEDLMHKLSNKTLVLISPAMSFINVYTNYNDSVPEALIKQGHLKEMQRVDFELTKINCCQQPTAAF